MPLSHDEVDDLQQAMDDVAAWSQHALAIDAHRARVTAAADEVVDVFRARMVNVELRDEGRWTILPLRSSDDEKLGALARRKALPKPAPHEASQLGELVSTVPAHLRRARSNFGLRKLLSLGRTREAAEHAARYLLEFHRAGSTSNIAATLSRLDDRAIPTHPVDVSSALSPVAGLVPALAQPGKATLTPSEAMGSLTWAIRTIAGAVESESDRREKAVAASIALRRAETARLIASMPLERLKEATRERISIGPLAGAGFATVEDVFTHASRLAAIPGIGTTSAYRIHGAAQTIWQTTYEEMPVRIDVTSPSAHTTDLVRCLSEWDGSRLAAKATRDVNRAKALSPLARALDPGVTHLALFGDDSVALIGAAQDLTCRARQVGDTGSGEPWQDFLRRPAEYFSLLHELGFLTEDEDAVIGGLPDDVVAAIRELPLDTEHLSVSLRGYQAFAARFALVQRKVIIGDEMGLGKTVEALAVLTHLRAKGLHHSLVICPAAVVTNWVREVGGKSSLNAHRLHGAARHQALRDWLRHGGVAVTTYESLGWLEPHLSEAKEIACVVVDEAHYIKNPGALRSQRSARIIRRAHRAVLLSGTPLENRVEDLRALVTYVRPDLAVDASSLRPRLFRQQVAPAYLRRNQEDVLTELPELVEVEEWLPFSSADARTYRDAVMEGNFHAMRQAALLGGRDSEKLRRLVEIVEEAEANERKIIVFSNYLQVLHAVAAALPGLVFGPLSGAIPAAHRQSMVDEFSSAKAGAALVAQIVAGGVGLNIQAASVVVLCEPQLKPTTEWQAIARAHRMGQLQSVQVHRLLSEDGVDGRIVQILAKKKELFADFAAISDTAETSPEAFDVSEAQLVQEVLEAERERLFGRPPSALPSEISDVT